MQTTNNFHVLLIAWLMTVALPTASLLIQPLPNDILFELPPTTVPEHVPFSAIHTLLMGVVILLFLAPFLVRAVRARSIAGPKRLLQPFPSWGYSSGVCLVVFILLSITRFDFFRSLQHHTFPLIWYSFIFFMESLVVRRGGKPGWERGTAAFCWLFALSAAFWWSFEYLNRFLRNWTYEGIDHFSPTEYVFFATISFATVLPALDAIYRYLETFPNVWQAFSNWRKVSFGRTEAIVLLSVSSLILFMMCFATNILFPFVWLSPLGILIAVEQIRNGRYSFCELETGDWSKVVRWMCSGLICGFLWELWNMKNLARWIYHVPYVEWLHVFEMPLLGYAGYIPFALLCGAIINSHYSISRLIGNST